MLAEKRAQVFLTNQSLENYKMLTNLTSQQSPAKGINELSLDEVEELMSSQFDPTPYIVRERFKFWTEINHKPGEMIQELAACIRHDAATCDFTAIHNPLDEALRTHFMCSVRNEAVLKALFKIKDRNLTFAKAIAVAMEMEEAAKVAKEAVYGSKTNDIHLVQPSKSDLHVSQKSTAGRDFPKGMCPRCGKTDHKAADCPSRDVVCHYCQKTGHLQSVCLQKKRSQQQPVNIITKHRIQTVKGVKAVPQLQQAINMNGKRFVFEVDTGAGDNFCTMDVWKQLGNPTLLPPTTSRR